MCVYGNFDMGVGYQNHGAPLNSQSTVGVNYLISKQSNGSYFGAAPNALSSSFIGLKGKQEIADNLYAVFNLQAGFSPESGTSSNGIGSIAQNNGLGLAAQNSFADSPRPARCSTTRPMPVSVRRSGVRSPTVARAR